MVNPLLVEKTLGNEFIKGIENMELIVPIIIMLIMVTAEALILQFVKKQTVNWTDIIFNLNSGHLVLWLFRGLELICYQYVFSHFSFDLFINIPDYFLWIFAILAWDLGFYWEHRLIHKIPFLWAVHIVHHQGEHFNLSLAVRNSWYSSLTSIPFFAILAIIGVPTPVFFAVSLFHYSIQFFNHNALTPKLGILEYIFVTPQHHRVHHLKNEYYSNHNFSGSFIFWDKLFASFAPHPKDEINHYGSSGVISLNPFWANNLPFMKLLNIKFRPIENRSYCISNLALVTGGLLLFALTICYIYDYGYGYHDVNLDQYLLFIVLVLGTIALGGVSEGRNWGIYCWVCVSWFLPLYFILHQHWGACYWLICMWLIAMHSIFILIMWFKNK